MNNSDKSANPLYFLSADEQLKVEQFGLTKREYFAGLAMQGMLSYDSSSAVQPLILAASSLMFADALLKELDKE